MVHRPRLEGALISKRRVSFQFKMLRLITVVALKSSAARAERYAKIEYREEGLVAKLGNTTIRPEILLIKLVQRRSELN